MDLTLARIPQDAALRYLGCPADRADAATLALVAACADELLAVLRPKWLFRPFALLPGRDQVTLDCGFTLPGGDIFRHLEGCHTAVLFCATLSAPADTLIRQAQATDLGRAVALDACATAAIEAVCDLAEADIKGFYPNQHFPFRFSPGYGDLPITLQQGILTLLDSPRKIGLCATDTSILTPRKSVTAILGVGHGPVSDSPRGCAVCGLRGQCQFQCKENHHD